MKSSELNPLPESIRWKYEKDADKIANDLFGHSSGVPSGKQPTNIIRDYLQGKGSIKRAIGFNQHMAWLIEDTRYKVHLQTVIYYIAGSEEEANLILSGEYDSETKKFSIKKAQYSMGIFDKKLKSIKFPTKAVDGKALAIAIEKTIGPIITKHVDDYAAGLQDYVAKGGRGMTPGSIRKSR